MPGEKEEQIKTSIHYYGLTKFYKSMQVASLEGVRLYPSDARFRFYYSISLLFEGKFTEAIRELDALQEKNHLRLAAYLALIHAHKKSQSSDSEVIRQLESNLRDQRKSASELAIYFACVFLLLMQKLDKATEYVDKLLKRNPQYQSANILKGWIEVFRSSPKEPGLKYFSDSIKEGDIEAVLGMAMLEMKLGHHQKSLDLFTTLTSNYPAFLPPLFEKMKTCLLMKDWDAVMDCSQRCLSIDRHSVEGLRYSVLHSVVWVRTSDEHLVSKLMDLSTSLELRETKSSILYLQSAKLFSRLSEKRVEVLRKTLMLADRASFIDQSCQVEAYNEMGYQNLLMGRTKDAMRQFRNANKLNNSDMNSLVGLLHCSVLEDPDGQEALSNLEALEQLNEASGLTPTLMYLCAMTGEKRGRSQKEIFNYLDSLTRTYIEELKWDATLSLDMYLRLNPDFVLDVVRLYLYFSPIEPLNLGQPLTHSLRQAASLLDPLLASCPAHREPLFLMAKVKFLSGNSNVSLTLLEKCLEREEDSFPEGFLLKADVLLHAKQFKASQQALDVAVSHDFNIREDVTFQIVKASLLKNERKYEEAISILSQALSNLTPSNSMSSRRKGNRIRKYRDDQVKISITIQLAQLNDLLDNTFETENLLNNLDEEFSETYFEGRIRLAKAKSALNKGSVDQAIMVLRSIGEDEFSKDYFVESRQMMADIYLKYRKDRKLYALCYQEIADKTGSQASYLMLGDAYMHILEPEKAVNVYETCLKKNPKDSHLIRKAGQALVTAHFFDKAVTYYKASIKTSSDDILLNITLKHDLARLLFRLKRHNEARDLINSALDQIDKESESRSNLEVLCQESKLVYLFAQILMAIEKQDAVINALKKAYTLQTKVARRISFEKPDCLEEDKQLLFNIGTQLANTLASSRQAGSAIIYFKELLTWEPKNIKILSSLANLELGQNNFEEAQTYTSMILKYAPDDDDASLMMTDMMISRNDLEGAFDQMVQFLEKKPTHFNACARFIELSQKLGSLPSAGQHLDRVLRLNPSIEGNMKYHFCRGLYEKSVQDSGNAISSFYKSKNDGVFGKAAILNMIDIYLNPDNEILGGSILESQGSSAERMMVTDANVKNASKLLNEFFSKFGESPEYHYYKAFAFLVRKHRNDIEQAITSFNEMMKDSPEYPPALFGLATTFALAGNVQKAKAALKRLFRQEWRVTDTDVYERSTLLMADIYLQSNKIDAAKAYIEKCLMSNRSAIRGYELLGLICEREGNMKDAYESYKMAFELCLRKNPAIGYKLAYICMKMKQYSNAVSIGREVLAIHPNYPKIEDEIINKSISARMRLL